MKEFLVYGCLPWIALFIGMVLFHLPLSDFQDLYPLALAFRYLVIGYALNYAFRKCRQDIIDGHTLCHTILISILAILYIAVGVFYFGESIGTQEPHAFDGPSPIAIGIALMVSAAAGCYSGSKSKANTS